MRKSTVLLALLTIVLLVSISRCDVAILARKDASSCGTQEQCEELARLMAMPEFQNVPSPASMQP